MRDLASLEKQQVGLRVPKYLLDEVDEFTKKFSVNRSEVIIEAIKSYVEEQKANIFYIHTFIRAVWLRDPTYSIKNEAVIWLFILVVSLALSILLGVVQKIIRFDKFSAWISNSIISWADRTL